MASTVSTTATSTTGSSSAKTTADYIADYKTACSDMIDSARDYMSEYSSYCTKSGKDVKSLKTKMKEKIARGISQ